MKEVSKDARKDTSKSLFWRSPGELKLTVWKDDEEEESPER